MTETMEPAKFKLSAIRPLAEKVRQVGLWVGWATLRVSAFGFSPNLCSSGPGALQDDSRGAHEGFFLLLGLYLGDRGHPSPLCVNLSVMSASSGDGLVGT